MMVRAQSILGVVTVLLLSSAKSFAQPGPVPPLPPVPVPPANPITEQKRVLGKILFWEEQLSTDNTMSCGSCHRPEAGSADPRIARNPGVDTILNTPDDVLGSPGVIHCDDDLMYEPDSIFGLQPQVTGRAANSAIMAMYAADLFWDGRARSTFTNPQTGVVSIVNGGALESQAVAPILSSVEKAHESRDWDQVSTKLGYVQPLVLASAIPADMAAAVAANPTYPQLFQAAFGTADITAERIAFAIATYERTLLPNQTPWDRFNAGEQNAMTPNQINGWNVLRGSPCTVCHTPPMFTNNTFQNLGLRPVAEDRGRQIVTGNNADRGRFKVPTLRNVGLKSTYMHTGVFSTLQQVIGFYANPAAQFPDNKSPLLPIGLPPPTVPSVVDFLENGLTDPRVAAGQFPFDHPTLHSDIPDNPSLMGGAVPGSGGLAPRMIAVSPPNIMNLDFKIGVDRALGSAQAFVAWSEQPPVGGQMVNATMFGPITLNGSGAGTGYSTWQWPIDELTIASCDVYLQWQITDAAAPGGVATSEIAHLRMIPFVCGGDLNCDGSVDGLDVPAFTEALTNPAAYAANHADCPPGRGDLNGDAVVNISDLQPFVAKLME